MRLHQGREVSLMIRAASQVKTFVSLWLDVRWQVIQESPPVSCFTLYLLALGPLSAVGKGVCAQLVVITVKVCAVVLEYICVLYLHSSLFPFGNT